MITTIDLLLLEHYQSPCKSVDICDKECTSNDELLKLQSALCSSGFIQLINHGIDDVIVQQAFTASREFFDQSIEQKLQCISKDKARRGYSPVATENFATLAGQSGKPNDTVEKFRIGPIVSSDEKVLNPEYYGNKEAKLHFFENEWNNTPLHFETNLTEYYREMETLSQRLLRIIERIDGLDANYFRPLTDKHTSILSLNYYAPHSAFEEGVQMNADSADNSITCSSGITRVAEHTDVSMLTLVAQSILNINNFNDDNDTSSLSNDSDLNRNDIGGLEVYDNISKTWLKVPYTQNAIIVNVGDCLSDWSRGRFKSSVHRVVLNNHDTSSSSMNSDSGNHSLSYNKLERHSLAYFLAPNYDAVLEWPVVAPTATPASDVETSTSITYTNWRKKRIKRALQQLKKG